MKKILILGLVSLLFVGCEMLTGKEIGRLPINKVSVDDNNLIIKETSLNLTKGDKIKIWSDMNVEYEGDVVLHFKCIYLKDGKEIGNIEFDPFIKNITVNEFHTTFNGKTKWQFIGKNTEIEIKQDGTYIFKGLLVASDNPTLKVHKAELIFKK